jgi:hypothetical protein
MTKAEDEFRILMRRIGTRDPADELHRANYVRDIAAPWISRAIFRDVFGPTLGDVER